MFTKKISLARKASIVLGFVLLFSQIQTYAATFDCGTASDNIATGDCEVLLDFYDSTSGPNRQTGGWDSNTAVCSWSGVECNLSNPKRVTKIEFSFSKGLYNVNLSGTLPASLSGLTEITGFIIVISTSNISGTLHSEWNTWTKITELQIYNQKINGILSPGWSTWTGIKIINLAMNQLTGSLPSTWSSRANIEQFNVSWNYNINGTLPNEWSAWTGITSFQVNSNKLTGSIPISLSGRAKINIFAAAGNNINGMLPSELSSWTGIKVFVIGNNKLTGTLPISWSGRTKITSFDGSSNTINGNLPSEWSTRTSMNYFSINDNKIDGILPQEWSTWTSISSFSISNNKIDGTLPQEWSIWTGMNYLYLNGNLLSGGLPTSWSGWKNIRRMYFNNNNLNGTLPSEWSSLTGIMVFNVSNNKLRGVIPTSRSGWKQSGLIFDVSKNALKSIMPTELINSLNGSRYLAQNCMKTGYSIGDITLLNTHGSGSAVYNNVTSYWSSQRQCNADIQITKTLLTPGPLYPGDTVSYLLNYQNNGYEDAIDVMIYDYTGMFLTLQSASLANGNTSTGWYFTGSDLMAGESGSIIITGIIAASVNTTGILNTGFISSYNTGDLTGNNRSFALTTVIDIVKPTPSFVNNVAVGPTTGDTTTISGTDNIVNSTVTLRWAYDADGICPSGSGSYVNSSTTWIENTEIRNGQYICIYTQDASGNTGTLVSNNPINIDVTPPASLPVCTTGQFFSGSIYVSCISAETGSFMRFLTGGVSPTASSPIWSDRSFTTTTNLRVTSCDALNNCNVPNINQIYTLDNTAPVTIINDTNSNRRNTNIVWNLSGTDAGIGGVQTYYKVLDGNVVCSTGSYNTYTGQMNINGLSGDVLQKTICFYSTDSLGNTETIKSQLYKIDMSNPTVAAPTLYSGALYGNYFKGSVSLQASLNDTGAGIKTGSCQVQTFLSSWSSRSLTTQIPTYCQSNNYAPNQSFSIRFLVNDAADNTGISNQSNYLYDGAAPNVGIPGIYSGLIYGSYYKGMINIQASVADVGSDLNTATCMYSLNNGSTRQTGVHNGGYCQDSNLTPNATINMLFRINDNLGTTGTSISNTYIYDTIAPVTTDNSDTARHNTDQTITLAANDTGAGVIYTQYCVANTPATCDPETAGTSGNSVVIMASTGTIVQQRVFYYSVDNLNNKETVQQSNTIKIDKIRPTGTIVYDISTPTTGDVVATLTGLSETGISITNNSGLATRTFTSNGSFTFHFQDLAGNTGAATATVTWIDTNLPLLSGGSVLAVNNTAVYNFTSTKAGTVLYSGTCGSGVLAAAASGNNSTTFTPLANGLYSGCQLRIIDNVSNLSNIITVPSFTISVVTATRTNSLGSSSARTDNCCVNNIGYGLPGANKQCKDYSPSYYDNTCEGDVQEVHNTADTIGTITTPSTTIKPTGSIKNSPYSDELNQAYLFAFEYSMTNKDTIQKADMKGKMSKIALAKMLVNYSMRVLGHTPNTGMNCTFTDISNQTKEMQLYAELACQLGIMGIKPDGKPSSTFIATAPVDRAMFGTTLSRMLWGNTYNKTGKNRYDGHLQALNIVGVMKNIAKPLNKEIRGTVMLMLMRAAEELK